MAKFSAYMRRRQRLFWAMTHHVGEKMANKHSRLTNSSLHTRRCEFAVVIRVKKRRFSDRKPARDSSAGVE